MGIALGCTLLTSGCAVHTPEGASTQFVRQLRCGAGQLEGPAAFESFRQGLRLKERTARKQTGSRVLRRSAGWNHEKERIGLVSSNLVLDPPDRFDLNLSWNPPRGLNAGLLQKLLGTPFGKSATSDDGWIVGGGILEYRAAETEVPYLLFSSRGYVRDPLDLLEAADLPHLPSLASVNQYLERNSTLGSHERAEEDGVRSKVFGMAAGISIICYSAESVRHAPHLAGLTVAIASKDAVKASDFVPWLVALGVPESEEIVSLLFGADSPTTHFAVHDNFALALGHSDGVTTVAIWRRIESPRSWCQHLRPDLERCRGE